MSRACHRVLATLWLALSTCDAEPRQPKHSAAKSAPEPPPPLDLDGFIETAQSIAREICPETRGLFDDNDCVLRLSYDRKPGVAALEWFIRSGHPELRSSMAPLIIDDRGTLRAGPAWDARCSIVDLDRSSSLKMRCSGPLADEQALSRLFVSVDLENVGWSLTQTLGRASSFVCSFDDGDGARTFWCNAILSSEFDFDSLPGTRVLEPVFLEAGIAPLDGHSPGLEDQPVAVITDFKHRTLRVSTLPKSDHVHLIVRGVLPERPADAAKRER